MTNNATNQTIALYREIREVLFREWDPIGVQAMRGAEDEYDAYVPVLGSMVIARKSVNELFEHLLWLETEHMGLAADRQRTQRVAEKLVNLRP